MSQGDPADLGNEAAERNLNASLAAVRAAAANKSVPTGRCFYCDDIVADEHLYCDTYCRDMAEREQQARRRNGTA